MIEDFWPTAWGMECLLNGLAPEEVDATQLEPLKDLALQRWLFDKRGWHDPVWFDAFHSAGLFSSPPPVVRNADQISARAWPVMSYLKHAADALPEKVAQILQDIDTDNWWVAVDGIKVAEQLPTPLAADPIKRLVSMWERAPAGWLDGRLAASALKKLAAEGGADVPIVTFRFCSGLLRARPGAHDLIRLIESIAELEDESASQVATGMELVATHLLVGTTRSLTHLGELDDAYAPDPSAPEGAIAYWLDRVDAEAVAGAKDVLLTRCLRLLPAAGDLPAAMGIRALRRVLQLDPGDATALRQLRRIAQDPQTLRAYPFRGEYVSLIEEAWVLLPLKDQVAVVSLLEAAGNSEEIVERLRAHAWLEGLASKLGPREQALRDELGAALGPPQVTTPRPKVTAFFRSPSGPLKAEDLRALSVDELVEVMRYPPPPSDAWPGTSTTEALASQVREEVVRRPGEFIDQLPRIADALDDDVLTHHLVWGLEEAFREESNRRPGALDATVQYLAAVVGGDTGLGRNEDARGWSVARAVASFLRQYAGWVAETSEEEALFTTLEALLAHPEPSNDASKDASNDASDESWDPVMALLNTVRGSATLAMLGIWATLLQADGERQTAMGTRLGELVETRARLEVSDSVVSAFGWYLPNLLLKAPAVFEGIRAVILPRQESSIRRWSGVWGSFVLKCPAHIGVGPRLKEEYSLAVDRLAGPEAGFLAEHAAHLLGHLLGFSLYEGEEDWPWQDWMTLLLAGLAKSNDGQASQLLYQVASDLRDHRAEGSRVNERLMRLVSLRLSELTQEGNERRPGEGGALAEVVMAAQQSVASASPLIRSLIRAGADVRLDDLMEYVSTLDQPPSHAGIRLLSDSLATLTGTGAYYDAGALWSALDTYLEDFPNDVWSLANALGRVGQLDAEETARRAWKWRERGA